jgi:hypothetical protein
MKILKNKVDLPPPPPIFNKDELISKINNKLAEELIGSVPIKLMDIKNPRRTWISYEYHLDIIYTIDNDPKQLTLLPNNFYDQHYELSFFDQLYNRLAKIQQSINNGA